MDIPEIPNSDIETPLTDEKLQIEEMKLTKKDGNFEHIPSTLQTATKTHSDQVRKHLSSGYVGTSIDLEFWKVEYRC